MSLAEQLSIGIDRLPPDLQNSVQSSLNSFSEKIDQNGIIFPDNNQLISSISSVFCSSQFVSTSCIKDPELIIGLVNSGALFSMTAKDSYMENLQNQKFSSEAELMKLLRIFRRREMVRIAWRDLAGWSGLQETMTDLTALAEVCIQFSLSYVYQQACDKRGIPLLSDGSPLQLVVLGMGKLGAWELNYSSDIDLIFAYAEEGVLSDRKETTYGEFFSRICRNLVKILDEITVDGFVFRTDVRLRPFGDSGPIVMSFDGMERYYQTQAREWERYAMIKARQVAGDTKTGAELISMLKPFVYRRYLDYGAFEELRGLKYKIAQELHRKDRLNNIKLGSGGIREIEFIGQAFQLIRGGNDKGLQQRKILDVLDVLGELHLMPVKEVNILKNGYCFLRRVENHIQQYQDKQTHDLPSDEKTRLTLAYSLGFVDWAIFLQALNTVRHEVHQIFDQVFSVTEETKISQPSHSVWVGQADQDLMLKQLESIGYQHAENILSLIADFKSAATIKRLTAKGAGVIDRLMPKLLDNLQIVNNPEQTLKRILVLLEEVAGRNVYLSLLSENPGALSQLIKLSSASPWISHYLSRYPVLFDELLDTRSLYEPLNKQNLHKDLKQQLQSASNEDIEQTMITLRKFKHINVLRVAAADIMEVIPLMIVSDYLTYIAEVLLTEVVNIGWRLITEKNGFPPGSGEQVKGFCVLGFGKLGGLELGYGSDLDLVFLYDCDDPNALTEGKKPVSCAQFYARLGQKVMNILNTKMLSGMLYEVDMRLRPSGKSGLLVSHVKAFEDYQNKEAWVWEHQALVRGRFITGDTELNKHFARIRKNTLCKHRDIVQLKTEVREMREKMRENLGKIEPGKFDLKHGKGGIADIEFIVQFSVLAWAESNEDLVTYTDNVRLLEGLKEHQCISELESDTLKKAYCIYRDRGHREILQKHRAVVAEEEFDEIRLQIEQIWHDFMEQ